jgi:translation initiation factor 2B subunit (eIF-2B alpha/beta/delta family)
VPTDLTPEERSLRARLAVHTSWANTTDPASRTAKARAAANDRFEKQAREKHPGASDEVIARVAEHLRKAHYTAMAMKSAAARRAKAAKPAAA